MKAAEARRVTEERRIADEKRLAEEKRIAEEKQVTEEKRRAEEARLAAEQRLAEEKRIAEAKRASEEKRLADERRLLEQKLAAEEQRLAQTIVSNRIPAGAGDAGIAVNPFSHGSSRLDTNYAVGDIYRYRVTDLLTKLELRTYSRRVSEVTDSTIVYNEGRLIKDLLLNNLLNGDGTKASGIQVFVYEYQLGKKWTTVYQTERANGIRRRYEIDFKVVGRETITVPAGQFDTWKVEGRGYNNTGYNVFWTYWIAPERLRHYIAFNYENRFRNGRFDRADRDELVSFQQKS